MQHMYIIRHGQSADNLNDTTSGSRQTPLTALGKQQALLVGKQVAKLGIDLIVSSPLKRAQLTAEIIAKQIGYPTSRIVLMPSLTERSAGSLQGTPHGLSHTRPTPNEAAHGVEPLEHLQARAKQALRILASDKTHHNILIVSHFWVGKMLKAISMGLPPQAIFKLPDYNNAELHKLF